MLLLKVFFKCMKRLLMITFFLICLIRQPFLSVSFVHMWEDSQQEQLTWKSKVNQNCLSNRSDPILCLNAYFTYCRETMRTLFIVFGIPICLSDVSCFIMTPINCMSCHATLHAHFHQCCDWAHDTVQHPIDLISEISSMEMYRLLLFQCRSFLPHALCKCIALVCWLGKNYYIKKENIYLSCLSLLI